MLLLELRNASYMFLTTGAIILLTGFIMASSITTPNAINIISSLIIVIFGSLLIAFRYEVYVRDEHFLFSDKEIGLDE